MSAGIRSINHVGIVNGDEARALSFYRDFLGFSYTREFAVAPDLSEQLFSISGEIRVLVFEKEGMKIEVFIFPGFAPPPQTLSHLGLTVDNLDEFIVRATAQGVPVITGRHKEKTVHFVKDFAGNLIEIKQG